ncbi:MAG: OmpA family protein [Candidatus Krumholzibacteriota bacterium]|nr:OmpA family protein [Candidatus Krumholzibacteriota bacterium]
MRTTQLFAGFAVVSLLLGGCTTTSNMKKEIAVRESKISELEADIDQKSQEIAALDETIITKQGEIDAFEQELQSLGGAMDQEADRADQLNADLARALGDLQDKDKVHLEAMEGMSKVTMPSGATFGSGSANLTAEGKSIIDTIWEVLSQYPDRDIFIEGHTDSIPIGAELAEHFPTNWALSSARAVSVLQYVLSKYAAEAGRLGAVGFGEYRPVATNSTEEGRSLNRRVVISVRPRE